MTSTELWLGGFAAASVGEWWRFFLHFLLMSCLAVGGAIAVAPEMHRVLVNERAWLSDAEFAGSIALAQAAPGPNVLFVAVVGYHVAGLLGAVAAMLGTSMPSTVLAVAVGRYGARQHANPRLRAAVVGLAPLTLGLIAATGWLLVEPWVLPQPQVVALLLVLGSAVVAWKTKLSPLWLIAVGAVVGALGWV
jgi:chromate transporter